MIDAEADGISVFPYLFWFISNYMIQKTRMMNLLSP